MDHLGIDKFLVMGFCIGGPMIHNLIKLAPERIVAACMMQPSGFRPEIPDLFYQNNIKGWGPPLCEKRPELNMDMSHDFLNSMYTNRADFVFTVSPRFRPHHPDPPPNRPRRRPRPPLRRGHGGRLPSPQLRGHHLPLERHPGTHRRSGRPRPPLPQDPPAGGRGSLGRGPGLTHALVTEIREALAGHQDPVKAEGMKAYMKSEMPYRGIQTPLRRQICRDLFRRHPLPDKQAWLDAVIDLWRNASYREERYVSIELAAAKAYRHFRTLDTLPLFEEMVVTGALVGLRGRHSRPSSSRATGEVSR